MDEYLRRAIAYILLEWIREEDTGSLYDYQEQHYYDFEGDVHKGAFFDMNEINLHDKSRYSSLNGGIESFIDEHSGTYITVNAVDREFGEFKGTTGDFNFHAEIISDELYFYEQKEGEKENYNSQPFRFELGT